MIIEKRFSVSLFWVSVFSGFLYVAIFSGNFNLSILLSQSESWIYNTRILSSIGLLISMIFYHCKYGFSFTNIKNLIFIKTNLLILAFSLLVLCSAINYSDYNSIVINSIINIWCLISFIVVFSEFKFRAINIFFIISFSFGLLWAGIYCVKILSSGAQVGEIPFGTSFTYYRIIGFSNFVALYYLLKSISREKPNYKLALVLSFSIVFLTIMVVYSMSKASFIAMAVGYLTVLSILIFQNQMRKAIATGLLAIISAFLLSNMSVSQVMDTRYKGLQGDGYHEAQRAELKGSASKRDDMKSFFEFNVMLPDYSHRIKLFFESLRVKDKWLGDGVGSFEFYGRNLYTKGFDLYKYPHNVVLEVYNSLGITGLTFFMLIICSLLFRLFKMNGVCQTAVSPLIGVCAVYTVGAMFGGDLTDFNFFWAVAIIANGLSYNLEEN